MNIDDAVRDTIAGSASKAYRWQPSDVVVDADEQLSTPGCKVYRASNRSLPDAGILTYAVLPDGGLAGGADEAQAAADVLRACGGQASVDWWMQVIGRFVGDAAGRIVAADDRLSIGLIEAAGGKFAPPVLDHAGNGTRLEYFVIRRMTEPAIVTAELPANGPLRVEVKALKRG